jgi:replicative DNA helicase
MSEDPLTRVPPQNLEAEQSVLGAILLDNESIDLAREILDEADCYRESHRQIFGAMAGLSDCRQAIDAVTLRDALRTRGALETTGGPAYIAALAGTVPTAANICHYARIVREKAVLRSLAACGTEIASNAYGAPGHWSPDWTEELLARAEYDIAAIASRSYRPPERKKAETLGDVLWKMEHGKDVSVLTGFAPLDQIFGGFNIGHLSILAARTSKGKTAFATNIAINAAKAGSLVAFFTLEMTAEEMWVRALGLETQVNMFGARKHGYRNGEKERVEQARKTLESLSLEILYRPSMKPRDLRIECKRLARELGGLKLVIVDCLNLMRGDRHERDRWREMQEGGFGAEGHCGRAWGPARGVVPAKPRNRRES